jgi:proteasome subunit B (beta)-like protein
VTIVVGVTTPDGLVLAADSRTTLSDGDRHRIASDSAQKIFPVGHVGVATSGNAFIGADTIAGTMDRFIAKLDKKAQSDLDHFVESLGAFFHEAFEAYLKERGETWDAEKLGYPIDFLVAGYDETGVGHIKELMVPGPKTGDFQIDTRTGGTMWRGQTDVISRLLNGVDWAGLDSGGPLPDDVSERLKGLAYMPLEPITVEDAVDYATFLVRTTIDMQRFSDGVVAQPGLVPGCGGPIHALVVERSLVRWASPSTRQSWSQATT